MKLSKANYFLTLVILLFALNCTGQQLPEIFSQFSGKNWEGHYIGSEDSSLVHHLQWNYELDSNLVVATKKVPALNFKMKTVYFIDFELNTISSITFINKAMYSKGKISIEDKKLVIEGVNFFPKGSSKFKQTFEVDENNILKDYFYREKNNKWIQGHFIKYKTLE